MQSVRQIGLRGAAPATDERAADWPTVTMTRHDNGNIHAVDGRAKLYSLQKNALKLILLPLFILLLLLLLLVCLLLVFLVHLRVFVFLLFVQGPDFQKS